MLSRDEILGLIAQSAPPQKQSAAYDSIAVQPEPARAAEAPAETATDRPAQEPVEQLDVARHGSPDPAGSQPAGVELEASVARPDQLAEGSGPLTPQDAPAASPEVRDAPAQQARDAEVRRPVAPRRGLSLYVSLALVIAAAIAALIFVV